MIDTLADALAQHKDLHLLQSSWEICEPMVQIETLASSIIWGEERGRFKKISK